MKKYLYLFSLATLSLHTLAFSAEVTNEELDQFVHRYLHDTTQDKNRHCHDGYCYYTYYDFRHEIPPKRIKIEENTAKEIVKSLLRQHNLLEDLAQVRTNPEFLPYLERYQALKLESTGRPMQPDITMILVRDERVTFYTAGYCDFAAGGLIMINARYWSCTQNDAHLRELFVFHQLAHCDLGRSHRDYNNYSYDFDDDFLSFMNFYLINLLDSCGQKDSMPSPSFGRSYLEENFEQSFIQNCFQKISFIIMITSALIMMSILMMSIFIM